MRVIVIVAIFLISLRHFNYSILLFFFFFLLLFSFSFFFFFLLFASSPSFPLHFSLSVEHFKLRLWRPGSVCWSTRRRSNEQAVRCVRYKLNILLNFIFIYFSFSNLNIFLRDFYVVYSDFLLVHHYYLFFPLFFLTIFPHNYSSLLFLEAYKHFYTCGKENFPAPLYSISNSP